jgi:putative membrane protein
MKFAALVPATMALLVSFTSAGMAASSREDFLKDAIKGDNSEIRLGHLAARSGSRPAVRDFGQTLVADHTKAKAQAGRVARQLGVDVPSGAMLKADAEYLKLQALSGRSFDREFVGYMIRDHQQDIHDFTAFARGHRGAVGDLAQAQLPTLHKHLRMAEDLMRP